MDLSQKTAQNQFLHKCLNRTNAQEAEQKQIEEIPSYPPTLNNLVVGPQKSPVVSSFLHNCHVQSYLKSLEYAAMLCNPVALNFVMAYNKLQGEQQQRVVRPISGEYLNNLAYQKSRIQQLFNERSARQLSPQSSVSPTSSANFSPFLTPRSTASNEFGFYPQTTTNNVLNRGNPVQSAPAPQSLKMIELSHRRKEAVVTSQEKAHKCHLCPASYHHKFELNRHVKVSHVRPHKCEFCQKGFGHRNYLRMHIETVHFGRKSYECRYCGKFLSTSGNLNVHVRTIHFGEKKYKCPICSRSFGQQCNMKTHMKRHQAEKN